MIIKISEETKEYLESSRTHPRETWDDLVQKLIKKQEITQNE